MKILVAGGLGFIGHEVVAALEELNHSVVIADTRATYGIIPQDELDYLISERLKKIKTDLIIDVDITHRYIHHLIQSHAPDVVIHLASFPRQKVVNSNPQHGSRVMSEGLLNLLEASVRGKVKRFVYVSSSMVYGDFIIQAAEDHPCHPTGQYGIMKYAGELLVKDYTRTYGLTHTIIRPSAVYGPLDVEDRVVAKFMMQAMRDKMLRVNGPDESLDFTYVTEVAKGIVTSALTTKAENKTYNITRGRARTLLDAANLAVKTAGAGVVEVHERDTSFPTRYALSVDAARRDLGFIPTVDIEEGFKKYHEWIAGSKYWQKRLLL